MSNPPVPRPLRAAIAAALALVVAILGTACEGLPEPVEMTRQLFVIFDVSGSMTQAIDGYANRARALIGEQPDGSYVTIVIADGASGASVCIPRTTTLRATGNNETSRADSLAGQRNAAAASVSEQVGCGKQNSVGGSDLIGSLLAVDARLKPGLETRIILFSDGMQYSADLKLTQRLLEDPATLKRAIAILDDKDLLPARMAGADFCITDPGVGSVLTAEQQQGVLRFWTAYARKGRATFRIC